MLKAVTFLPIKATSSSFGTRWGNYDRKVKSCHSDQKSLENIEFSRLFLLVTSFFEGCYAICYADCVTP